ncbi:hypothetical protein BGZ99_010185, partial [Dissophora globulifera]
MDLGLVYPIMRRAALAEHYRLPLIQIETPYMPLLIAALAFTDDTTWAASSQQNLQNIVNIATSFFELNSIKVNAKKTELLVINSDLPEETIQLGDDTIRALCTNNNGKDAGSMVLCRWKKNDHTRTIVWDEVRKICQILARKAATDKQAVYIVNNVLIPRILYRLTTTILSVKEVDRV